MKQFIKNSSKRIFHRLGYDFKVHRIATQTTNIGNIAFVHVPKSGGISIDLAMREQFAKPGQARFSREGAIAMSLATFAKSITGLDTATEFSDHHAQQLSGLLAYHLAQNWPYVSGHITTNKQLLARYTDHYHFVTVLREPVSRFTSNYIFNKLTNALPIMAPNNLTTDNLIAEVDQILDHRRGWQMANVMGMCITGRFARDTHDAKLMQQEFSDNLSHYKVVGFLDDLPSFTAQIKQLTNKQIKIGNHNTTESFLDEHKQHIKSTLKNYFNEPHIQAKIAHLCRFDSDNYLRAKEKSLLIP
ncbi:sulfotransferase family 2 domain-containing protein [Pseudoalteromonas mariniglutinosa]|uniref:sulfotransferase family 2 domain-containing protein n=1 Tax=Pseudoalteromonas mariniglutinosa TaxID=206042 RepID=UPI00384F7CA3